MIKKGQINTDQISPEVWDKIVSQLENRLNENHPLNGLQNQIRDQIINSLPKKKTFMQKMVEKVKNLFK